MPCRFRLLAIARFRHTVSVMILSSRHFSRDLDRCTCAHGKQAWRAAAARLLTSPRLLLVVFSSRWKMTRTLRKISPPCSLVVSTRSGGVWRSLRYVPSCRSPMLLCSRRCCIQPPVSTSPTPFPVWLIILVLIVSQMSWLFFCRPSPVWTVSFRTARHSTHLGGYHWPRWDLRKPQLFFAVFAALLIFTLRSSPYLSIRLPCLFFSFLSLSTHYLPAFTIIL